MLTGKKVLVIGLAKSGRAAINLLYKLNATITVNEYKDAKDIPDYQQFVDNGIEMITGSHPEELFERDFDFVIKNPGINYHKPFILRLKERNIPVYTEIELAYQVAKKQNYIGVTGTNGKTTTCLMIYQILKMLKQNVAYMGTVGFYYGDVKKPMMNTTPDVDVLYNMLLEAKEHGVEYFVMEVSSHALDKERIYGLEFDEVAFSNLTQDHLDYHKTIENYANAKRKLFEKFIDQSNCI